MKATIIGGAGRVGSNTAFALQMDGTLAEIVLVDVMREQAQGEALDLRHGAALAAPQRIRAGGCEDAAGSDLVIVTAGLRRKPDESRLELVNRNVALFRGILDDLRRVPLPESAILIVVANPVDVLTYLAATEGPFAPGRVIGTGTLLDTARLRSLVAEDLGVDATQVDALVLGEHGDSMVPIWSSAAVNGVPLRSFPGFDAAKQQALLEATRKSGAEVIRLKGGAGYSIALATREVVRALALDRRSVLPVSSLQAGAMGISGVALSLPTVLGARGIAPVLDIAASDEERDGLLNSARVLRDTLDNLNKT